MLIFFWKKKTAGTPRGTRGQRGTGMGRKNSPQRGSGTGTGKCLVGGDGDGECLPRPRPARVPSLRPTDYWIFNYNIDRYYLFFGFYYLLILKNIL